MTICETTNLFEDAVDKAMNQFGTAALKRAEEEGKDLSLDDLCREIASYDPTQKKTYTPWLVRRYGDGGIKRFEDMSRARTLLAKYEVMKRKSQNPKKELNILSDVEKDINRIKTIGDLQDIIEAHEEAPLVSRRVARKEEEDALYRSGQAIVMHNDATVKIVIPKTEEASCYFGMNTRWCTAATDGDNRFSEYEEPLYIILIKKLNERYQFNFENGGQFMDEKDEEIDPRALANEYPILWEVFSGISLENGSLALVPDPSEEEQLDALDLRFINLKYIDRPSEKVQLYIVGKIGSAIQYLKDPSEQVQLVSVKESGYHLCYIKNPTEAVKMAAVKQWANAIKFCKDPSEELQMAAVEQNPDALTRIKNPTPAVRAAAQARYDSLR